MHTCPVCGQLGISSWAKFRSGTLIPAVCKRCGAKSFTSPLINGLFGVVTNFGFLYSAWVAFTQWSWLPLIIFVVVLVVLELMIIKFAPLVQRRT